MTVQKIALEGGPQAGKTTVLKALEDQFGDKVMFVPEIATVLLRGGFPIPGEQLKWSEKWQAIFQTAIIHSQRAFEKAWELAAEEKGISLLICDRGLLGGAAYTPGGVSEFCRLYGVNLEEALASYAAVIHLESLATANPKRYGKAGNAARFEPLERAQQIERAMREAWSQHPRHVFISGKRTVASKISEVVGIVKYILAQK